MSRKAIRIRSYGISCVVIFCALGTVPHSAYAQVQQAQAGENAEQGAGGLEEIVVTARKREENLQTVPVAVTAFSQESLRENNIVTPYDLEFHTPGLQVRTGSSADSPQYFIRGQGSTFSSAPGVVPYFAESPLSNNDKLQIYDMESVQVLKGPQGTLFGRSTTGGAILMMPHKPTDDWEGYVDAKYGDYNMHEVEAALNIPVVPGMLDVRLSGDSVRRDGYTTNLVNGAELDSRHRDSFRLGITFKLDGFENYALFQVTDINETGSNAPLVEFNPQLPLFNTSPTGKGYLTIASICGGLNPGSPAGKSSCTATRVNLLNELVNNLAAEANRLQTGGSNAVRYSQADYTPMNISDQQEIHDIATYDLGKPIPWVGDVTLKNVLSTTRTLKNFTQYGLCDSAYLHCENNNGGQNIVNGALIPDPSAVANNWFDHYTEEFQVAGNANSFNWIVGYFDQSDKTVGGSPPVFPSFNNVFSPSLTNAVYLTDLPILATSKYTNYFGQSTVKLGGLTPFLEGFNFTGGYAVSHLTSDTLTAAPVYAPSGVVPGAMAAPVTLNERGTSYNFSLDREITPDLLAYITTRKGFKQGGANTIPVNPIPGTVYTYAPEEVKDVEIGTKYTYRVGDVAGRSNLALYYDWYTNIQRNQILINPNPPFGTQTQINNIGAARIYGLEWENEARIDRLLLTLNYSYIQAAYTKYPGDDTNILGQSVPFISTRYPGTPTNQLTVGAHYDLFRDDRLGVITLGADGYWQSTVELDDEPTNDPYNAGLQRPYHVLNLRLDWTNIASAPVDVSMFVTNATDSTFMIGVKSFIANLGTTTANYNEPRMFGIELRARFGGAK
jgi:iron complex outermembrane recepter protein